MNLVISRQHLLQLSSWAVEAHPQECCGLLLGEGNRIFDIVRAENVATLPEQNFEIDPVTLISAEKAMRQSKVDILGYFHSHPNGVCEPSMRDAAQANRDGRYWVIVTDAKATAWRAIANGHWHDCFDAVELICADKAQG
jgi:desampylase